MKMGNKPPATRTSLGNTIKRSEALVVGLVVVLSRCFDVASFHCHVSRKVVFCPVRGLFSKKTPRTRLPIVTLARRGRAPRLAGPRGRTAPYTMGCCISKSQVEEPGAYEARRAKILEAADARDTANKNRGLNPRAAQKLREAQSKPMREEFTSRKDAQMVNDWNA